ncbi:hypothetical protein M8J77_016678 [Diaphorina citri]|nr:hypothetical protein M8J77_016678 [Diaphorina citri]
MDCGRTLKLCPHIVDRPLIEEVNLCCRGSVRFQSSSVESIGGVDCVCGHSLTTRFYMRHGQGKGFIFATKVRRDLAWRTTVGLDINRDVIVCDHDKLLRLHDS